MSSPNSPRLRPALGPHPREPHRDGGGGRHVLHRRPLAHRVVLVAAGEQVRRRQPARAEDRAVGAAADRDAARLEALAAQRLLRRGDDLRALVEERPHVRVLRRDLDLDVARAARPPRRPRRPCGAARRGSASRSSSKSRTIVRIVAAPARALDRVDVDEALAVGGRLRGELGRQRGEDLAREPGRVHELAGREAGMDVDAADPDVRRGRGERLVGELPRLGAVERVGAVGAERARGRRASRPARPPRRA